MSNSNKLRFQSLTGIRFIAVCLVFIYHNRKYWRSILHPEVLRFFNEFHIGVSLFFVLSGFLIAYTYEDNPLKSPKDYLKYFLLRCARIFPLYWFILTAYYIDKQYGNFQFSWLNYTLLHGFSDIHCLEAISQSWSLTVEMSFYFLAPFLVFVQKRHLLYLFLTVIILYVICATIGVVWQYWNKNPDRFFMPINFLMFNTFPGRSTEFIAGMLLASWIQKEKRWLYAIPYKTILGFVFLFIFIYLLGLFQKDIYDHGYLHFGGIILAKLFLPIIMVFILAGLICEQTWIQNVLGSPFLVLLGNASFAFYLVHISYINLKVKQWYIFPDRNFCLLWVISILLYKYVELPIYTYCRKKIY